MILYDPIITNLQAHGGITVYYNNLLSGCDKNDVDFKVINNRLNKCQRYFDVNLTDYNIGRDAIFHSSYYRLPVDKRVKTITTVHDFTYEKFVNGVSRHIHSWQKMRAIKNSDLVICVSKNTANDLMDYCSISSDRVKVVYNGVSNNYHIVENKNSSYFNKVVFIGARGGYKNFKLAVNALKNIQELELLIVGGGALNKGELTLLNGTIPQRYKHLGKIDDVQLNLIYNSCFCLLYPSSYEGFGIPVIEAMRAGCPVIAVNSSSIPEVAGQAALLAESASADEFDSLLRRLFINSERLQLINKGIKQSQLFSWEKCFSETNKIYNEL